MQDEMLKLKMQVELYLVPHIHGSPLQLQHHID